MVSSPDEQAPPEAASQQAQPAASNECAEPAVGSESPPPKADWDWMEMESIRNSGEASERFAQRLRERDETERSQ